jgi:hypothetical protein
MITKTLAFKVGDDTFGSLEEAQAFEIALVLSDIAGWPDKEQHKKAAEHLVKARERVLDILSTTPRSKTRARKINGGSKKRAEKPTIVQPQAA